MELKLDRNREYAVALGGGGARGAYEVGVWEALAEEGIRICAVSGTSVGAINGAFMAMDELELAKKLWGELTYSKVMDVDDDMMRSLIKGDLGGINLKEAARSVSEVVSNGGFEVEPLMELLREYVDEERVRSSEREFYIITYSLTDKKELELRARDLEEGMLHEMLLASAYLPVFRNYKLGGKRYLDGGVADTVPTHVLVEQGYKDIIAVELNALGVDRKVRLPRDVNVHTIAPRVRVGSTLDFDTRISQENLKKGYYDAKRMMYGLEGSRYVVERTMSEREAFDILTDTAMRYCAACGKKDVSLRTVTERMLPRLALRIRRRSGDYYDLFLDALETAACYAGADRYRIVTDRQLLEETEKCFDVAEGELPKAFTNVFAGFTEERNERI